MHVLGFKSAVPSPAWHQPEGNQSINPLRRLCIGLSKEEENNQLTLCDEVASAWQGGRNQLITLLRRNLSINPLRRVKLV